MSHLPHYKTNLTDIEFNLFAAYRTQEYLVDAPFAEIAAATVRAGFSKAGMPTGLQIVGPRHRDGLVLQAAFAYEQARPWAGEWPQL